MGARNDKRKSETKGENRWICLVRPSVLKAKLQVKEIRRLADGHVMPEETAWYFAYGSNLDLFQMIRRVGEWKAARRACLSGYRLVFDKKSSRWGGFTANVHHTVIPSDHVYGVVYELRKSKVEVLAGYEGASPTMVDVKLEDGTPLRRTKIFLFAKSGQSGAVPKAYQNAMLDGLRQHGYDESIIRQLASGIPQ